MKVSRARLLAFVALGMALPFSIFLFLLLARIEPPFGPIEPFMRGPGGQAVIFGALGLATMGLPLAAWPVLSALRHGGGVFAHKFNLISSLAILAVVAGFATGFVADQYPCWIGEPNCD